jgi:hypothetical protein
VTKRSVDALMRNRGWAIVSTHLGKGFFKNGKIDSEFRETMEYLAGLPGWFVPTSQLLDFLVERDGCDALGPVERFRMEASHVLDRLMRG